MKNNKSLKILFLKLTNLRNEEHFQFMTEMKHLFADSFAVYSVGTQSIDPVFEFFIELYEDEETVIENIRTNELTKPIADADMLRGKDFRGLSMFVETYIYHSDKEKYEAARKLKIILDHYGNLRRKNYMEESASIYNLLQELTQNYPSEIELIGLGEWVANLEAHNQEFDSLIEERFENNARKSKINLSQTRKDIDLTYRKIASYIEVVNMLSGGETYAKLIAQMNEIITYYKHTLAQRKGRADA